MHKNSQILRNEKKNSYKNSNIVNNEKKIRRIRIGKFYKTSKKEDA